MWHRLKRVVGFLVASYVVTAQADTGLNGAGASSIFPVMIQWADVYRQTHKIHIKYQATSSQDGAKQVSAGLLDFAISNYPLTDKRLRQAHLVQFPVVIDAVVPVVNLKELKGRPLRLSGELLAAIYFGQVKYWNDEAIKQLNPQLVLPQVPIVVFYRQDISGTSQLFSYYLSKKNAQWKKRVGFGSSLMWPVGISARGNEGVSGYVSHINGAIGYLPYAFAMKNKLPSPFLETKSGEFVGPSLESFNQAGECTDWFRQRTLYNRLGSDACPKGWPLASADFVLMKKDMKPEQRQKMTLHFFKWVFLRGGDLAKNLGLSPVPVSVAKKIQATWGLSP